MACFGFAGSAGAAMAKEDYKVEKDRVEADYKAARQKCNDLKANAKDICMVEAKGNHKVAKAQLEAQHEPSPRHDAKVKSEKAEAAYDLAKQKCDDLSGTAKDACKKDAQAAFVNAKGEAKVTKAAGEKGAAPAKAPEKR
jgi:hypothetical protein